MTTVSFVASVSCVTSSLSAVLDSTISGVVTDLVFEPFLVPFFRVCGVGLCTVPGLVDSSVTVFSDVTVKPVSYFFFGGSLIAQTSSNCTGLHSSNSGEDTKVGLESATTGDSALGTAAKK